MTEQAPRATRAVSEDGLSICSLMRGAPVWGCTRYDEDDPNAETLRGAFIPDSGQSADEVLAQFEQEDGDGN